MEKLKTNQKGITLIALIITIIVMLILVVVTVTVALNGGLFDKADEAATLTTIEQEKEALNMAAISAWDANDGVKFEEMELPEGITGSAGTYTSRESGKTYKVDPKTAKVTEVGSEENSGKKEELDFEAIKQDVIANPEVYLAKAKEAGQVSGLTDIGIGTDGEIVNLDLWRYEFEPNETLTLGGSGSFTKGYLGGFKEDGTILGEVPQYIYSEGKIFEVEYMYWTFCNMPELKIVPKIPDTVTSLYYAFYNSTNLTTFSEIPESVTSMTGFRECKCLNITGRITIKSDNEAALDEILEGLGSAEKPITLIGTGDNLELLEAIKANGNSEYITIEQ